MSSIESAAREFASAERVGSEPDQQLISIMLSKLKSPSLIERRSPIVHVTTNQKEHDQHQSADEAQHEDDDLESQQTATDLVIDQQQVDQDDDDQDDQVDSSSLPQDENTIEKNKTTSSVTRRRSGSRDLEHEQQVANDNNNNINENNNNNENSPQSVQQQQQQQLITAVQQQAERTGKKTQNELMDIIENSRKRRLSKDSADSLTSFIRWSFSHFDEIPSRSNGKAQEVRRRPIKEEEAVDDELEADDEAEETGGHRTRRFSGRAAGTHRDNEVVEEEETVKNLTIVDEDEDYDQHHLKRPSVKFASERVLRNRATRLANSSSSGQQAAHNNSNNNNNLVAKQISELPIKRARASSGDYSHEPKSKVFSAEQQLAQLTNGIRPKAQQHQHQLMNGADRQHQQRNIKSLDHIANQLTRAGSQLNSDELVDEQPANGLSLQLQQFIQQQQQQHSSVLDELMLNQETVSPGAGRQSQSSQQQQIALAAAIHRALLGNGQQGAGSMAQNRNEIKLNGGQHHSISPATAPQANAGQQLGGFLADSLNRQQQQQRPRAYNTRGLAQAAANLASNRLQQQQLAISNRVAMIQQQQQQHHQQHHQQQQRHAQAAAALSVLANGAHPAALHHFAAAAAAAANPQPVHQHLHQHPQPGSGSATAAAAAAAALQHQQRQQQQQLQQHQHQQQQQQLVPAGTQATAASLAALANQTEFKCDTCPSSFDDRHRLMQHQSIHLELKKDWFTETPVEEVMKIFNRRRGEFLCNLCNLRFEATLDYDQHNHQVHGPRPYCCQFCGNGTRTFKCWRQYLNHLYDHRYVFSCTIGDCDFTVNRRDSLRFHIFRFHLNCQLPQNQLVTPTNGLGHHNNNNKYSSAQLSPYNLSQSGGFGSGALTESELHFGSLHNDRHLQQKWSNLNDMDDEDEDEDTENEMNVAD